MKADIVPLSSISPDGRNANRGTERGRYALERSLEKLGAGRSILLDKNGKIIAGNKTAETAGEMGIEDVVIIRTTGDKLVAVMREDLDLDEPNGRARELAYADNRVGQLDLEFDPAVIAFDLEAGLDLSDFWNQDELTLLTADIDGGGVGETADAEPQTSRADELQREWGTATGQLWRLESRTAGQAHYLICGDCTDKATVERVMMGEKADMVFTDPPYGVDYQGGRNPESNVPREKLAGDGSGSLYLPGLRSLKLACKDNAPMYIWFAASVGKPVYDAVEAIGYTVRAMIVWNKLDAHYGNFMAQYMQKHEPCLYIVNGNPSWVGATNEVTVWDLKQPSINEFHPTQKPAELATRAIKNHDAPIVADFFLGSGSTLIAAENLGRQLRGCEISPAYVAVALQRYADAFGIEPELIQ